MKAIIGVFKDITKKNLNALVVYFPLKVWITQSIGGFISSHDKHPRLVGNIFKHVIVHEEIKNGYKTPFYKIIEIIA